MANAPTSLTSASQTNTSITAAWNANSNPSGTEYYIENMTAGTNSGWTTDSSWSSASLTCGTEYTFRVKARNGATVATAWTDNVTIATGTCTANTNGGGGGVVALPPATGFGQVSANIAMGQNSNIGDINNTGTNVLAYINSSASFQATVSNHDNEITQEHRFKIIDLDLLNNIITVQINSVPQIVKLNLAESKTIDLDNDGVKDLEIKFANLYVNRAELTMSSILNETTISKLIKYNNSPKVYLLENNKKRWIIDGETFSSLGYQWDDVKIIDDSIVYNDGENLSKTTTKYTFKNFLKLGQTSEEVLQLQSKLKNLGYFSYPKLTGYFGAVTETAVKAFQNANNIDQFGYVGPATRAALNK